MRLNFPLSAVVIRRNDGFVQNLPPLRKIRAPMEILSDSVACVYVYSYVEARSICAIDGQLHSFSVAKRGGEKVVAPVNLPVATQRLSAGWRDMNARYFPRRCRQAVDDTEVDREFGRGLIGSRVNSRLLYAI